MAPIDHYNYWYNQEKYKKMLPREIEAIRFIDSLNPSGKKILDAGCGDGSFLIRLEKRYKFEGFGAEYSQKAVQICKKKKLNVLKANLESKIPFKNQYFDIIYAGEIIEHLYNPDKFLEECFRILKKGGSLIITTPNLSNWYNRLLFLFGIQPVFIETSTRSKSVGAGILSKLKKEDVPVGHVRVFNYTAIKDILKLSGFKIIQIKGVEFEHFPKRFLFLDKFFRIFPRLSSGFVILAKKAI